MTRTAGISSLLMVFGFACPLLAGEQPQKPAAAVQHKLEKSQPVVKWIWVGSNAKKGQTAFFRKEFATKPGRITGAKLYASCDDGMSVAINGKHVLDDQDWATPVFADVTEYVRRGRNVITVQAKNSSGPAGLVLKLVLESSAHDPYAVVTDESWTVSEKAAKNWKAPNFKAKNWLAATVVGKLGDKPRDQINEKSLLAGVKLREPTATPIADMKITKGFRVELLYSVPKDEQGSWVNITVDPKGRLIVSDQYGKLYRVTPPPAGETIAKADIEPINVDIGEAQGLLWAFDSLYVSVNTGGKYKSGLYRVRDTDGDDQLDRVELLRELTGGGEHGPHAILLTPDKKSLYYVAGDGTKLTEIVRSRAPQVWGEDLLLPRIYGRGFMKGVLAPGGWICKIDPDGKNWELIANGFRNEFDAALNRHGELFTFDADMEWDMNTPWYRPTRVCHVVSGAEFGWRNGSGKWPAYFPDSVPPVVNIGPGSPTGITFGYGAKFPAKYQEALFICDWSYGKLYVVHLKPQDASYSADFKEFITGTPLPLTDIVINPHDGAMYFAIGGRKTKSGLYRVTYTGSESTASSAALSTVDDDGTKARALRQKLESFHVKPNPKAVEFSWPHLGSSDRFIRWAARVAIEKSDVSRWQDRAIAETDPQTALTALLALARMGDKSLAPRMLDSLSRLEWENLTHQQRLGLLRVYGLVFMRMQAPDEETRLATIARFDPYFPAVSRKLNAELCQLLVYLQAPNTATKGLALLAKAPTQEEQIEYAKSLRRLKQGWTMKQRKEYFSWFIKAGGFKGGASFGKFVQYIKDDAVGHLTDEEKVALKTILETQPNKNQPIVSAVPRPFVKKWSMEELVPLLANGLKRRDFDHGRAMFAAANCFACHRFDNEGGAIGPDLTGVSGRFNHRDLLESVVTPSKVISDQYRAVQIITLDGKVITGRIANLSGDSFRINTNMLDPNALVSVDRKQIDEMLPSKISMMPKELFSTLNRDEILDLMAYLLSRGDRDHTMFQTQ